MCCLKFVLPNKLKGKVLVKSRKRSIISICGVFLMLASLVFGSLPQAIAVPMAPLPREAIEESASKHGISILQVETVVRAARELGLSDEQIGLILQDHASIASIPTSFESASESVRSTGSQGQWRSREVEQIVYGKNHMGHSIYSLRMTVRFDYNGEIVGSVVPEITTDIIGPGRAIWSHESTEESGGYCVWNGNQDGCGISFAQANFKACMPIPSFEDIGCFDSSSLWIRMKVFGNGEYTTKTSAS